MVVLSTLMLYLVNMVMSMVQVDVKDNCFGTSTACKT
jgi:hypothetical protein